jgi:hypothetical protein
MASSVVAEAHKFKKPDYLLYENIPVALPFDDKAGVVIYSFFLRSILSQLT